MLKFPIEKYKCFSELPLTTFTDLNFSVYVLDFDWNYLFVNPFVRKNLKGRGDDLIGKNMWMMFPQLKADASFFLLKENMEKGMVTNIFTISPLNSQRLNINGYPLEDCYFFTSSIVPDREEVIQDLRNELVKRHSASMMDTRS